MVSQANSPPPEPPDYIAVVAIATGYVLYCGNSVASAAAQLHPGTCYGCGGTKPDATAKARKESTKFLELRTGNFHRAAS